MENSHPRWRVTSFLSKISFWKKNFENLSLFLGEREGGRVFSRMTFAELSYRKSGGRSAIFVKLGCIHHVSAFCISKSRKLSTATSISRRERNEKRGSRYLVYMTRFLQFICAVKISIFIFFNSSLTDRGVPFHDNWR